MYKNMLNLMFLHISISLLFFQLLPEVGLRITHKDVHIISSLPDDMSFCIADVKFDAGGYKQPTLKLLEFGEGQRSKFKGHDSLFGTGMIWSMFWNHLAQFRVPVWLIGLPDDSELRSEINFDLFTAIGGKTVTTVTELTKQINADLAEKYGMVTDDHRKGYCGIVVVKKGRPTLTIQKMKETFQQLIFVGQHTNKFVNNKYRTDLLFNTRELKQYRPHCKSCSTEYDPQCASQLIQELGCDIFVLKPVNSSRGRGVIMVAPDELDATLKLLLADRVALATAALPEEYIYWATYKIPYFLVEEYQPSKQIIVNDQPYDATMRLVFTLDYVNDTLNVKVLDGYWKLPAQPLTANCSLTDKHKSHIIPGLLSAVKIAPEDLTHASMLLEDMLRKIYWQMIASRSLESGVFGEIFWVL